MPIRNKKAQASMMEYIIATLFMLIIIVFVVIMLFGVQFMSISGESNQQKTYRSLALLKTFSNTQLFTKDNSMTENPLFYDKKLTAAVGMCSDLEKLFGSSWSVEITIVGGSVADIVECTETNYPDCNKWIFCQKDPSEKPTTREVAINVYRENSGKTEAALMKVSTYV